MQSQGVVDYSYYSDYSRMRALEATEVNGLPNIILYAVLLLFYAILIGPILYSLLRKRRKRELLWRLIPLSAVVFSVLIYLIGTSTRIKHPYINYLSQIDLSNEEVSELETYFSLTSPNNDKYDVEISGQTELAPYVNDYYNYDETDIDTDYQYGMEYTEDKTELHMDNMASFDAVYLKENQKENSTGRIEFTDLRLDEADLTGLVTNHSGYDLEDCMIVCGGDVVMLGEMKQGESISLDQMGDSGIWHNTSASEWEDTVTNILEFDESFNSIDVPNLQRVSLLSQYGNKENTVGYYFYGFLADEQDTAFTDQFDLDLYGETAVVQQLTSTDLENNAQNVLGTLEQYIQDYPDGLYDGIQLDSDVTEMKVTYDLSDLEDLDQLQLRYRSMGNMEFELLGQQIYENDTMYVDGAVFLGKVVAVNQTSGKPEVIFTSGNESLAEDLSQYIDQDGKLELTYQIEIPDQSSYDYEYSGLRLPRLILERRNVQ